MAIKFGVHEVAPWADIEVLSLSEAFNSIALMALLVGLKHWELYMGGDIEYAIYREASSTEAIPERPATVPEAHLASLEAQLIGYSLKCHVPAMQRGFEIITPQGTWRVDGELAEKMAEVMRQHLMHQLETV